MGSLRLLFVALIATTGLLQSVSAQVPGHITDQSQPQTAAQQAQTPSSKNTHVGYQCYGFDDPKDGLAPYWNALTALFGGNVYRHDSQLGTIQVVFSRDPGKIECQDIVEANIPASEDPVKIMTRFAATSGYLIKAIYQAPNLQTGELETREIQFNSVTFRVYRSRSPFKIMDLAGLTRTLRTDALLMTNMAPRARKFLITSAPNLSEDTHMQSDLEALHRNLRALSAADLAQFK